MPWHENLTCAEYQALPVSMKNRDDIALLKHVFDERLRQCPKCRNLVEKSADCHQITCRCGCEFCYACGAAYVRRWSLNNKQWYFRKTCSCREYGEKKEYESLSDVASTIDASNPLARLFTGLRFKNV